MTESRRYNCIIGASPLRLTSVRSLVQNNRWMSKRTSSQWKHRWKYERGGVKPFYLLTCLAWRKTERWVVKHSPVFVTRQSDRGDSKHIPRWRPAGAKHENHVETQTRKSAVTVLKWYPEIRADFRKLPRSRVGSQVESKLAHISVYLFSVQKQTPASAEIMHAWLIEPHASHWTQKTDRILVIVAVVFHFTPKEFTRTTNCFVTIFCLSRVKVGEEKF